MTEQSTVNVPLLRKVLDHITAHPEEHDQREYGVRTNCGTAYCLAGHVAVMQGHELRFRKAEYSGDGRARATHGAGAEIAVAAIPGGGTVEQTARDALGLDRLQAYRLFHEDNTLDELWTLAGEFTDGAIQRPAT